MHEKSWELVSCQHLTQTWDITAPSQQTERNLWLVCPNRKGEMESWEGEKTTAVLKETKNRKTGFSNWNTVELEPLEQPVLLSPVVVSRQPQRPRHRPSILFVFFQLNRPCVSRELHHSKEGKQNIGIRWGSLWRKCLLEEPEGFHRGASNPLSHSVCDPSTPLTRYTSTTSMEFTSHSQNTPWSSWVEKKSSILFSSPTVCNCRWRVKSACR